MIHEQWDIPFSRLGYGCYALGGAYGNKVDPSRGEKLIHLAYDLGIRFFDTADRYGSEEILGKAVKPFRREVSIATKVGVDSQGKMNLSKNHVLSACDASLKRMNTDYLDLYQVHYDDPGAPVSQVVEVLEQLKKQGKIRQYGVGHLPLDKTRQYLEYGRPLSVLAEMSPVALNRYQELQPLQERCGFGIIAFSVTGRGLLTGKIGPNCRFAPGDIRSKDPLFMRHKLASGLRVMEKLARLGKNYSASPAQVAIAWVLNRPGVKVALTGPTDPAHLKENCGAMQLNLDPADLEEISAFIRSENRALQAQILQDIQEITREPLKRDPAEAANDLLYALEHGVEYNLLPHETAVRLFVRVMKYQKSPESRGELLECQREIRTLLQAALRELLSN